MLKIFMKLIIKLYRITISIFFTLYVGAKHRVTLFGKVYCDAKNIEFGSKVILYPGVQITGSGIIIIGNNVAIGKDTIINATNKIVIGNNTLIAAQSYIIDSDHGINRNELIRCQEPNSLPITIGNDVWVGAGAKILKGATIQDGSIIGALSLVKGTTEPYSINVGIPIRKIGNRT